jgi:hypothetical protein
MFPLKELGIRIIPGKPKISYRGKEALPHPGERSVITILKSSQLLKGRRMMSLIRKKSVPEGDVLPAKALRGAGIEISMNPLGTHVRHKVVGISRNPIDTRVRDVVVGGMIAGIAGVGHHLERVPMSNGDNLICVSGLRWVLLFIWK